MKPARTASTPRSHWPLPVLLAIFASTLCPQESRTAQVGDAALGLSEFEVASIKPTDVSGQIKVGLRVHPGGRVVISGCELTALIRIAFHLSYQQITGGADWTNEIKYDIEAVPPKQADIKDWGYGVFEIRDEHLRQMLQAFLVDRFQLQFHRATKTGDVYLLKRNGKPPAFHPTSAEFSSPGDPGMRSINLRGGQWRIGATSMPQLAQYLCAHVLGAPVLDRTELKGEFDYKQNAPSLDPADPNDDLAKSFLRFIQELQLKLERAKGPVETFVIDRAAKPSPN